METEKPFVAEYAKSGRASCKKCKQSIEKDDFRLGILQQSHRFDGKMLLWHHMKCFFEQKNNLQNSSDIANFDNLRWEDQEQIKKLIAEKPKLVITKKENDDPTKPPDFMVELAKSNRSTCRQCGEKIKMGSMRISKLDENNPTYKGHGPNYLWHHADCFVQMKQDLGFYEKATNLPGFDKLCEKDQQCLEEAFESYERKRKAEDDGSSPLKKNKSDNSLLKKQNDSFFEMRDKLKTNLSKQDMEMLLCVNEQHVVAGENQLLDHLSDCLVFGALKKCPDCKKGVPYYLLNTYVCSGSLSDGAKCQYKENYPSRVVFDIPETFRSKYDFLKYYECIVQKRHLIDPEQEKNKNLPLGTYKVAVFGKFTVPIDVVKKKLQELGATIQHKVDNSLNMCVSTDKELESESLKVVKARVSNVPVVSYDFVSAVQQGLNVAEAIEKHLISTWNGNEKSDVEEEKQ